MRRLVGSTAFLLASASGAVSCPAEAETFLSCTFQDGAKYVQACIEGGNATYRYGPTGGVPELELSEPLESVAYEPWSGVGWIVWEELSFRNGDVTYSVSGSATRRPIDEDEALAGPNGSLAVWRGDVEWALIVCDEGSVDFPWSPAIYDAKREAGQCWGQAERMWSACEVN